MNDIEFFNLSHDGDSAIVRILNTTVDEIEVKGVHFISVPGQEKKKAVACLGEGNCPLCDVNQPVQRLCVHLWDYTDNKEKIWNRTPNQNFLNALNEVVDSWGDLCDSVIKIARSGDNYPKYSITVLNPKKYPFPDAITKDNINEKVSYRLATYRSAEELEEYVRTGFLPDHVKKKSSWVPKEEWLKKKQEEDKSAKSVAHEDSDDSPGVVDASDFDDPFM